MTGSSVSSRPTSFGASKLLPSSSLGPMYPNRVAFTLDQGCAALSTAVVGSSVTLSGFYLASVQDKARHCYGQSSSILDWFGCLLAPPADSQSPTLLWWLDSSADSPKMDLFSDDIAPFGFTSSPACPVDSEHLERSFDLMRYQHAVKRLGVPSLVNHGIRMVARPTGSQSHGGTSTADFRRPGSSNSDGSRDPFLDGPRRPRNVRSNNGAASGSVGGGSGSGSGGGSGSGSNGNRADRGGNPTRPSAHRAYKVDSFGPPPPPPPPPGDSDAEGDDDDYRPISYSDWDSAWKAVLLGAAVGHLLNKFFPQIFRKTPRFEHSRPQSVDADTVEEKINIFGVDEGLNLVSTFESQIDPDICPSCNRTDRQPVETLSASLPSDSFLRQLVTFSAGTSKAIAVLLFLVCCAALRKVIAAIVSTAEASTMVVEDDRCQQTNDTVPEDKDDTAPGEPDVDSTVFGNPLLLPNEVDDFATSGNNWATAPVEAVAPVEDFGSVWTAACVETPVAGLEMDSVFSDSESALSDGDSFWTTKTPLDQAVDSGVIPFKIYVEAPAPESGTSSSSDPVQIGSFLSVAVDGFDWDRYGSFQCSTPLTRSAGTLSGVGDNDFTRAFVGGPPTGIPTIAIELENTKKNLDTIIEAQIKRAEMYTRDSYLQPRDADRSLSSSMWASSPGTSSGGQGSSSRLTVNSETRSFVPLPYFPINNAIRTPNPNTAQLATVTRTLQQAPGRRRRHGRHREEESSDVPDWANA